MFTMSHAYVPEKNVSSHLAIWQTLFQILGASALIAICSQIKIDLPFTPVPLTLQTLAVLSIGATLGSRKGACAILLYFAQILAGMPVLAGGVADPLIFLSAQGGYVIGFCFQAFLMGWITEKMPWSKPATLLIGGLLSCSVQMGLGVCVLAQFVGWNHVCAIGLFPFLPGEILKVILVSSGLNSRKILT